MKHLSLSTLPPSRLRKSCLKMPTPPPTLSPSSSRPTPARHRSLRWHEPISQYRSIPPREEDYYATFQALPFASTSREEEEDEPLVPFLRSGHTRTLPSTPEPAWLKQVLSASEGGSDIDMDLDHTSDNGDVSPSVSSPISEANSITLLEIGEPAMLSPPSWSSSPEFYLPHSMDDDDTMQNMILFANLNPGFSALSSQLHYLSLQPTLQEPQSKPILEVQQSTRQHSGAPILSRTQHHELQSPNVHEAPRTPLATIQTNTPTSSPSPGPSTHAPPQLRDNNHNYTQETQLRMYPSPSASLKVYQNAHITKFGHNQCSSSPERTHPGVDTDDHTVTPLPSNSCLDSGPAVFPANPQPHHEAHTNKTTETVLTGLGAYSKGTITQTSRPAATSSAPPLSRTAGAVTSSHHPQPVATPEEVVASTSAKHVPAVHEYVCTPLKFSQHEERAPCDGDVEMEPPLSESESEEGEVSEDVEDQVDELLHDEQELEEGEINHGAVSAVLRSHIAEYRASQAGLVGSSSAFERRRVERRERRRAAPGMGMIGRLGQSSAGPRRTGASLGRHANGEGTRARAVHVPSIAGHLQQPTIAAIQSGSALVGLNSTKQHYPLTVATVNAWRTELDRLKCLCTSAGVFKNPSQYQSELGNVLKQIEENEDNPDLTVGVLIETGLLKVLKAFQHCNGGSGPGLRCFKRLVAGICQRWRDKVRVMESAGVVNCTPCDIPGISLPGIGTGGLGPSVVV